ncbi:MAG: aspartate kinase [Cytophagales bacterium]|nr:aspartate kinase [Cytophagales bacterium]
MKILKFSESSFKDAQCIDKVLTIIRGNAANHTHVVVVCPTIANTGHRLAEMSSLTKESKEGYKDLLKSIEDEHFGIAKHFIDVKRQAKVIANLKMMLNELEEILYGVYLLWELSPRTLDHIHGFGTQLTSYLLSECIKETGTDSVLLDSKTFIKTNDRYGHAQILEDESDKIIYSIFKDTKPVTVVSGGVGSTLKGESTVLGKSGVSYTASYLAATLKCEMLEVYTTRDGIYNSDKRWVHTAYSLPHLTYNEAMEMANFDMDVIYPPAFEPAFSEKIPVLILNLFNPDFKGTLINDKPAHDKNPIKCTSAIARVSLLTIQGAGMIGVAGVAARFFATLANMNVSIVFITQSSSEQSITVAIASEQAMAAKQMLDNEFEIEIKNYKLQNITIKPDMAIVAIIGENMKNSPGIAGKIFTAIGHQNINIAAIAQGSSELNISIVVESGHLQKVLNTIQTHFFAS